MLKSLYFIGILSLLLSCKNSGERKPVSAPQVNTTNGTVEGVFDEEKGLNTFFGIPYAQPPVGGLRWKAPQELEDWEGIKETKSFGSRPMQIKLWDDLIYRSEAMSEDCLYLNIWAPAAKNEGKLPVLFYIYGGGFSAGDGSEPRYDGASLAQKDMVVVTINYRLNVFGFLALPELSAESPYGASGNYGLLDQVAALKWVKNNVSSFGGDPNKITIAGESAGSISVSSLMASPLSKNLIAGAIGESGAAINPTLAPVSLKQAEENGVAFAKAIKTDTLADLRALNSEALFDLYQENRSGFPTVLDDYLYPKTLPEIFAAGEQAKIPLLVGWNSAELPAAVFIQGQESTEENFMNRVKQVYPDIADEVLKRYAHNTPENVELSATALASDGFIAYSTWKWFDLQRKNSNKPVYRYLFSKIRPAAKGGSLAANDPKPVGAGHANEIEYALGNLDYIKAHDWTADDHKVSETMENYFANFVKTGNPNGDDLAQWPAAKADSSDPMFMNINTQSKAEKATHDDRYRLLDSFYRSRK